MASIAAPDPCIGEHLRAAATRRSWFRRASARLGRSPSGSGLPGLGHIICACFVVFSDLEDIPIAKRKDPPYTNRRKLPLQSYQREGVVNAHRFPSGPRPGLEWPSGTSPRTRGRGCTSPGRRAAAPFVILTAQLMVVLDTTIVNVALPHIQQNLGFSTRTLSWVLNAYILTFGGLLLLGARAGDLFGRRRVFLLGIAVFTLSSLVGGLAPAGGCCSPPGPSRALGAALAAPSALSLLTTVFAEGQERVRAIGLYTTVSAAGGATGLVAGGLLTQLVSWRWVMFVNVPIGVAVWLVGRIVIVETERRRGRFDLAGALTCTLGVSAIVFGLVEAGSLGWTAP